MKLDIQMTETDGRYTGPPPPPRRKRGIGVWILFALIAIGLIGVFIHFERQRRGIAAELHAAGMLLEQLHHTQSRLKQHNDTIDQCKKEIRSVLSQCRSPADIPDLGSERIFTYQREAEQLFFYLPDGKHTLEISTYGRKKATTPVPLGPDGTDPAARELEQTWSIPLPSSAGYVLEFVNDRTKKSLNWILTSNTDGFEKKTEKIDIEGFEKRGASWYSSEVVLFPNQIDMFSVSKLEALIKSEDLAVTLLRSSLQGSREDEPYDVYLSVRLKSDGPPCVSAPGAAMIYAGKRDDLISAYRGAGKYELRTSVPPTE